MKFHLFIAIVQIFGVHSLIVPDEIPTILSVIYSNIPVIKKGTDSRIGWGFRLGNRADFQVLVELGPQKYTQPLANEPNKVTSSKRNTVDSLANTLYAQRQRDKQNIVEKQISDTEGGKWLENWSKSVKHRQPVEPVQQELPPGAKPGLAEGEIDAKSVIPDDETLKLIEKYLQKQKEIREKSQSLKSQTEGQSANKSEENSGLSELSELYHAETSTEESESVTESTSQKAE